MAVSLYFSRPFRTRPLCALPCSLRAQRAGSGRRGPSLEGATRGNERSARLPSPDCIRERAGARVEAVGKTLLFSSTCSLCFPALFFPLLTLSRSPNGSLWWCPTKPPPPRGEKRASSAILLHRSLFELSFLRASRSFCFLSSLSLLFYPSPPQKK